MTKKFLFIYTRVFDPFVVTCFAYLLVFSKFGHFPTDLGLLFFVITVNLIIPIFYFLKLLREKQVGDWDVTNKKERRKLIGPLIIFISISTVILYSFTLFAVLSPSGILLFKYLLKVQIAGILLFSYLYFVSPVFKSSGHVGTMSVFYPFVLKILGTTYWWVIILIVIQAVARVKLKKHTAPEVIAGFVSGMTIGNIVFLFL